MQALSEAQKIAAWRRSYLWLVAGFYFCQGFYYFGSGIYLVSVMADWGVAATTQATVIMIISIPGYLQILPGLLTDRVPVGRWGRRKPYILMGALLYIPGFLLLLAIQRFNAWWLSGLILTLVAYKLVDTSLDALVIDLTPPDGMTRIQGAARGSRLAGMAVTGLMTPILGPRLGWASVLWLLCLLALLQSTAALLLPEPAVTREALRQVLPLKALLRRSLRQPVLWTALSFALFFSASYGFESLVNVYLLTELGWNSTPGMMQAYGVTNLLERLGGVCGALLVMRLSYRYLISLKFYAGFFALFWLLLTPWLVAMNHPQQVKLVYLARSLEGVASGMFTALYLAIAMRLSPPSLEGFTFSLLGTAATIGERALGINTVSLLSVPLGSLAPAFFSLIPFSLISLIFLRPVLNLIRSRGSLFQVETVLPLVEQPADGLARA